MLELQEVSAGYGDLLVLRDISLHVRSKQVVAVLGANGAGKSTLLRTVAGSVRCSSGRILLQDQPIEKLKANEVANLGLALVPEGRRLFAKLSVEENLLMGSYTKRARPTRSRQLDLVYSLFPVLKERASQPAGTLSGGEQQMCAIGRGLMSNPDILVLDEISLGIAPVAVERLYGSLAELKREGLTMLLVEQSTRWAFTLADYAIVMQTGQVVARGTVDELQEMDLRSAYLGI